MSEKKNYDHMFIKMHLSLKTTIARLPAGAWCGWRQVVDAVAAKGTRKYPGGKDKDKPKTPNEAPREKFKRWLDSVTYDGCECESVPLLAILEGAPWSVLSAIALHVDENGEAWPGLSRLSWLTGLDRFTVSKAVLFLRMLGLLSVKSRFELGEDGGSNVYTLDKRFFSFGYDDETENGEIDLLD